MRLSFIAAGALVSLALAPGAPAQNVDDLVAKHVAARGGYDKLRAVQTIKITRTVATPFSNVKVVIYKKRPNLFRAEQTSPNQPMVPRGINAEAAWDWWWALKRIGGTFAGLQPPMSASSAAAETRDIDGDFDGLLVDWKDKGHTVTFEGKEPVSGADAYKLKVTTKAGAVRYVYLDAKAYLERRQTGQVVLANNRRENTVIDFSNYKAIDAVQFPFNIDEDRTGPQIAQSFATYTEKIELNLPMDDALFATPQTPAIGTPKAPGVSGARQAPR